MGSFSGGKFSKAHSTAIEAAEPLLAVAAKLPEVTKISLGFIKVIKGNGTNLHRFKYTVEPACLKVVVRGGISVQEIRLYCENPTELTRLLPASN